MDFYTFKTEKADFENFANDLPNDVYSVETCPEPAHAMVYIKTEEGKHIIYDPNLAILAVDPSVSATRLYEIVNPYTKGEDCHVSFSPCSLIQKNISKVLSEVS